MLLIVRGLMIIITGIFQRMTTDNEQKLKEQFGQRLRKLRKEHELSQEELALSCGLDRTYIGGIERGERNVSLVNIVKIAEALKITPKDFFE